MRETKRLRGKDVMGRPLKPTALKMLAGNPGKRPLNDREPKPKVGATMPEYLMQLPGAAKKWRSWAPKLEELGVLTEVDAPAFGRLCRLWDEDEDRAKWKDEEGHRVGSDYRLLSEIRALEGRFGMTPSDRAKIKVESKKPESKLGRFTKRGIRKG